MLIWTNNAGIARKKKFFFPEGGFHRAIFLWARAVVDLAIFSGRVSKSRIGNFGYLDVFHAAIPKKNWAIFLWARGLVHFAIFRGRGPTNDKIR